MLIRRPRAIELALAATLFATPMVARADDPSVAEQLFLEGRKLMADKRYADACAKFKASRELDPTATGTLLNLALCHEASGKTATAWAEFRQVVGESEGKRPDRVAMAREHITALAPTLSYLSIEVPPAARVDGLVVTLDDVRIADAAWGTGLPVDPGVHVVGASAPGKIGTRGNVSVAEGAAREVFTIRALADAPTSVEPPPPPPDDGESRRTIGWALGGVGVAGLGAGLVFGLMAGNLESKAKNRCGPDYGCASTADASDSTNEHDAARRWATVSTVVVVVSAVAIAGGIALVLTSPRARASAFVVPGGLVVRGDL